MVVSLENLRLAVMVVRMNPTDHQIYLVQLLVEVVEMNVIVLHLSVHYLRPFLLLLTLLHEDLYLQNLADLGYVVFVGENGLYCYMAVGEVEAHYLNHI